MGRELVITSGDVFAARLHGNGIGDEVLAWRDILYEGPVPLTADPAELSQLRAAYLHERYPEPDRDDFTTFQARDRTLARHADFDMVSLWFEPDLCDTLQLLQVLDYLAAAGRDRKSIRLVHTDRPLAAFCEAELAGLADTAKPMTTARLNQAREAWLLYRQPDPRPWAALMQRPRLGLKHLWSAINVSIAHLPLADRCITRIETIVLRLIAQTPRPMHDLFEAFGRVCDGLGGRYMGDWSFFALIDELACGASPLIAGLEAAPFRTDAIAKRRRLWLSSIPALTVHGREVLQGARWRQRPPRDIWLGGTHIAAGSWWEYDEEHSTILTPRR